METCEICGKNPHTCVEIATEGGIRCCGTCAKLNNLVFAAEARCPCGAGLAYNKSNNDNCWDCSDILLGKADKKLIHTAKLPFVFWEIKSEEQPSAKGLTTRQRYMEK